MKPGRPEAKEPKPAWRGRARTPDLDGNGMTADDLGAHLKVHWPEIRSRLLGSTYEPQPARRVEIPKASGGVCPLGVPTALDRFIQQAVMRMLQGDRDGSFLETRHAFRPKHSAHQAVARAGADLRGLRSRSWSGSPKFSTGSITTSYSGW